VIDPGDVAFFLSEHPDMHLTRYDNEIRALLDGFDAEELAALWLQADSYIRNQIIDTFEKSDLRCAQPHCKLRLPNKEERRWIDLTREWVGQYGLENLYEEEKPFCLCPEKDLGISGDKPSQWRRKRAKLVAAVVIKYHKLDENPTHPRNARFLLKNMTDLVNGKRLRDETLKRHLRRFIKFGDKWLYEQKMEVPGHGEICVADMIDIPLFSDMLLSSPSYEHKKHRTVLDELRKMSSVLGRFLSPWAARILFDSQYPNPFSRKEDDPDEAVWRRMADDDFNGDPWDPFYQDPDFPQDFDDPTIDGVDEYDPELFALEAEMEAASAAEPGMSNSELRDKLYWEHPELRGNRCLHLDWYKTCDAFPLPGLLGIGGEPFVGGVRYHEFDGLRGYVQAVLAGKRFAYLFL